MRTNKKLILISCILLIIICMLWSNTLFLEVDGASMTPSIQNGQHIIVTKLATSEPGDIVLVSFISRDPQDYFLKRLIAEENDSIRIQDGIIYINNIPYNYGPNGQWTINNNFSVDGKAFVVPKGYVFVLGDNRNQSQDSRVLGLAKVIGKVIYIY